MTTSLSFAIFGGVVWWLIFSIVVPTTSKINIQLDTTICCCSLLLHWWYKQDWNRRNQPMTNTVALQVLSISSIMFGEALLMDLCMDLFAFGRLLLTDDLVRVSRHYTLVFQVRVNYAIYMLLVLQPLSAIYCYFFISSPFIVLSFGIVTIMCLVLGILWNVLVVKLCHYSKVQIILPGTQQPLPASFDYALSYHILTLIHCAMFIAMITTVLAV
jgi:hypothetical protein